MEKKALGRGLQALLPERPLPPTATQKPEPHEIPVDRILPNRYQPRSDFNPQDLSQLTDSIKQNGIIQPVLVRRKGDGFYELIAGERRLRAAKALGFTTIPTVLRNSTDEQAMELALVENLQRKDLNPIEAARAYQRLMGEFGLTQEMIAQRVGKDRSSIANMLRLLNLPRELQEFIESGQLTTGHAKVIAGLESVELQRALAQDIVTRHLSVREAEKAAARLARPHRRDRRQKAYPDVEERLQKRLGTKVSILKSRKGGKVVLHYFTPEELDRLLDTLLH